jgi:Winged helix DNA-binding domain
LRRAELPVYDAIEHLAGIQAQEPPAPYYGLWSRLANFPIDDLSELITGRKAVRTSLMRCTLHLVTARDVLAWRAPLQAVLERGLFSGSPFARQLEGIDIERLLAVGRELLDERPRTVADLSRELHARWPDYDRNSLAYGVRYLLPLVQVPPRGLWGVTSPAVLTTVEAWLGEAPQPDPTPDAVIRRYLGAFGPASVSDVQQWSGLTGLRPVLERLRPELRVLADDRGRELFDVPHAPLADPDTPAPPRFLPWWDNVLVAYSDRRRIIPDVYRKAVVQDHLGRPPLLVDGMVAGFWELRRQPKTSHATLRIEPFVPPSARQKEELEEEGARLLAFAAAGVAQCEVVFAEP